MYPYYKPFSLYIFKTEHNLKFVLEIFPFQNLYITIFTTNIFPKKFTIILTLGVMKPLLRKNNKIYCKFVKLIVSFALIIYNNVPFWI